MTAADIRNEGYKLSANTPQALIDRMALVASNYILGIFTAYGVEFAEEMLGLIEDTPAYYGLVYIGCVYDEVYATRTGGERKRNDYGVSDTDLLEVKKEIVSTLNIFVKTLAAVGAIDEVKPLNTSYDPFGIFFKTQFFY